MTPTAVMSTSCSLAFMLGQRVDRLDAFVLPGPFPVRGELLLVEDCPFGHERESAPGQRAGDQLAGELDRRGLFLRTGRGNAGERVLLRPSTSRS